MSFFFFLPGSKSPSHKDNTAEIWARLVCEAVPSPPSCREKASTKGTAGAPPARDIAAYLPLSQHELPTDGNPTWRARVWRAHLLVAEGTRGQAAPPAERMSVRESRGQAVGMCCAQGSLPGFSQGIRTCLLGPCWEQPGRATSRHRPPSQTNRRGKNPSVQSCWALCTRGRHPARCGTQPDPEGGRLPLLPIKG